MAKKRLSFWQIFNMNFGFLGIQFGWALQLANMSAIFSVLGAHIDRIPVLWLAGPITGLLVQPIVGAMSDRTWTKLGRRRPYFLTGALLAGAALFVMPDSPSLLVAALLMWLLDASTNISMEPFRAFVADNLAEEQRTLGFIMQSFFIGLGATLANVLPRFLHHFGVVGYAYNGVPMTVHSAFKIGAVVFIVCVLWTVLVSFEYPPENLADLESGKRRPGGLLKTLKEIAVEIGGAFKEMPATMKQLAAVQIFTYLGFYCMWLYFGLNTAYRIFGAANPSSSEFARGIEWAGWCFAIYSIVCFLVAFFLPSLAKRASRKLIHSVCLASGGISLMAVWFVHDKITLQFTMIGVGIAWASILSMPYAILADALPEKRMGVYMGVFNFFIVTPQIIASLGLPPLLKNVFHEHPVYVVITGGAALLIASGLVALVNDRPSSSRTVKGETIELPALKAT